MELSLELILAVVGALVGWPFLTALLIDILKWAGVVKDGTSGKWSLGFQLLGFVLVGVSVGFFPNIDVVGIDALLLRYAQIAAYVFALIVQMSTAKAAHGLYTNTRFGKKFFSYSTFDSETYTGGNL